MTNSRLWLLGSFVWIATEALLYGGSLRLMNDSGYPLTAEIYSAGGSLLGTVQVDPGETRNWSSEEHVAGDGSDGIVENPTESQTPYTVHWYCKHGGDYGICPQVATGATVFAKGSEGQKACPPPKKTQKDGKALSNDTLPMIEQSS